jgi:hypothetical protein
MFTFLDDVQNFPAGLVFYRRTAFTHNQTACKNRYSL